MSGCRTVLIVSVIAALSLSLSSSATAQLSGRGEPIFLARLDGAQETPAISTQAEGDFRATLSRSADLLEFQLNYSGLEGGNTLFAHVHFGQTGVAGGVMFFLCGGGGKPACTGLNGTISGSIVPADIIGPTGQGITAGQFAEAIHAMRAGLAYANVHTTSFPAGEIRGQVK